MEYIKRLIDKQIVDALARSGAVLIEGPKSCGKTASALQHAHSSIHIDTDPSVAPSMEIDPSLLLSGATPRLLDEWQVEPALWDVVRHEIDDRRALGQFILTGSTAPTTQATRHSGAGRVARLRMHTMTLHESGHSTGEVSLQGILNDDAPRASDPGMSLTDLVTRMSVGGWPLFHSLSPEAAMSNLRDYVQTISDLDVQLPDGPRRDPRRVRRLLRALARSTASEVSLSTLARDEATLSRDAVRDYLDALTRIFISDDQPAWSTHLRSTATLRKEPKRHFCDPALAVAALGTSISNVTSDLNFAGQLFESFVVHELRALTRSLQAEVFHARDSRGNEIDAVVETQDGSWAGFEIKLGARPDVVEQAATSLKAFADNVATDSRPILTVITGSGISYRRRDGVNVVAVGTLAS